MSTFIQNLSILSDSKHSRPTIFLCDLPAPRAELQSRHIDSCSRVNTTGVGKTARDRHLGGIYLRFSTVKAMYTTYKW